MYILSLNPPFTLYVDPHYCLPLSSGPLIFPLWAKIDSYASSHAVWCWQFWDCLSSPYCILSIGLLQVLETSFCSFRVCFQSKRKYMYFKALVTLIKEWKWTGCAKYVTSPRQNDWTHWSTADYNTAILDETSPYPVSILIVLAPLGHGVHYGHICLGITRRQPSQPTSFPPHA